ncbi:MAG: hypothetical protein GXP50_13050 [Deltaproteobacteria bacterium]|nr:hypothetical protein [Deltaproteobacteria bacterium]
MGTLRTNVLAAVAALLAIPAWAADFTVTVPVDLSRIPAAYPHLQVKCWALCEGLEQFRSQGEEILRQIGARLFAGWDRETPGPWGEMPGYEPTVRWSGGAAEVVGMGMQTVTIPPDVGEYHGIVAVSFDAFEGYAPNNVRSYVCAMKLSQDGRTWEPETLEPSDTQGLSQVGTVPVFLTVGAFDNPAADPDSATCRP